MEAAKWRRALEQFHDGCAAVAHRTSNALTTRRTLAQLFVADEVLALSGHGDCRAVLAAGGREALVAYRIVTQCLEMAVIDGVLAMDPNAIRAEIASWMPYLTSAWVRISPAGRVHIEATRTQDARGVDLTRPLFMQALGCVAAPEALGTLVQTARDDAWLRRTPALARWRRRQGSRHHNHNHNHAPT